MVSERLSVDDLQAAILHLMRHRPHAADVAVLRRDFRLTDVHGEAAKKLLA